MTTQYDSNHIFDPAPQQAQHTARPLQHLETVKDTMVLELRRFFEAQSSRFAYLSEVPTIDKYKIANTEMGEDPYVTSVQIMRALPDISQKLPLLAITAATGRSKKFGIGSQYVGVVQDPPRVRTTVRGPWAVEEDSQLLFVTGAGQTVITLSAPYVNDFSALSPVELVAAINAQSNRLVGYVQPDSTVEIQLKTPDLVSIEVAEVATFDYEGTIESAPSTPEGVIVVDGSNSSGIPLSGSNSDASAALGLTGQSDDVYNPARPPKHRYQTAKELTLSVDIGAEDDNQRTELTDLVCYFYEMFLQHRDFVLVGDPAQGQNWQIALKYELALGGESEIPRAEGDSFSKIYINRISIPLLSIDYVDRPAVRPSSITYKGLALGGDRE